MVCTKDIRDCFKELSSSKRIDLMCSLLHMCLPWELRFIGSCIEDLAKKDYTSLRDAEQRANDSLEIKRLSCDIFNRNIRSKLNVYLSLLYSHNTKCSHPLFDILTHVYPALQKALSNNSGNVRSNQINHANATITNAADSSRQPKQSSSRIDKEIVQDLQLLLTLAANHPAFEFNQKQTLCEHLQNLEILLREHDLYEDELETSPVESCQQPNISSEDVSRGYESSTLNHSVTTTQLTSHVTSPKSHQHTHSPESVFVKNIELQKSQCRQIDRRHEFLILVTWSDGQTTEALRTYQDLYSFHAELIKLFPKDSGAHKQERHIPFLPQEKSHNNKEMQEMLRKYIRQLSALPDHMMRCDHMTTFFGCGCSGHVKTQATKISNANAAKAAEEASTQSSQVRSLTFYNSSRADSSPSKRLSEGNICRMMKSPGQSPRSCSRITNVSSSSSSSSSPSPWSSTLSPTITTTTTITCATTLSTSPLAVLTCSTHSSGGSCPYSPTLSTSPSSHDGSSRLESPSSSSCSITIPCNGRELPSVENWLKKLRLHKYKETLGNYTWPKLMTLTDQELEDAGLTQGARGRFCTEMDQLRKGMPMMNGLSDIDTISSCSTNNSPGACSPPSHWPGFPSTSVNHIHSPPPPSLSSPRHEHHHPPATPDKPLLTCHTPCLDNSMSDESSLSVSSGSTKLNTVDSDSDDEDSQDEMDSVDSRNHKSHLSRKDPQVLLLNSLPTVSNSGVVVSAQSPPVEIGNNHRLPIVDRTREDPMNGGVAVMGLMENKYEIRGMPFPPPPARQMHTDFQMPLFYHPMPFYHHTAAAHHQFRSPRPIHGLPPGKPILGGMINPSPKPLLPHPSLSANTTPPLQTDCHTSKTSACDNMVTNPVICSSHMTTSTETVSMYKNPMGYPPMPAGQMMMNPPHLSRPNSLGVPVITAADKYTGGTNGEPAVYHNVVSTSTAPVGPSTNAPGLLPAPSHTPPIGIAPPLVVHQHQHHPPSTPTPPRTHSTPTPPATVSSCSSCGCNGHCSGSSNGGSQPGTPGIPINCNGPCPTRPPFYQMWQQSHMYQGFPIGPLPATSNGLVGPAGLPPGTMPFPQHHPMTHHHPPPPHFPGPPNGITPELFYNNQLAMMHQVASINNNHLAGNGNHHSNSGYHQLGQHPFIPPSHPQAGPKGKMMPAMCHNCGGTGHWHQDCKQHTLEAISHEGQYHLDYKPHKQDSD